MFVLKNALVARASGVGNGWIAVEGDRILETGIGSAPRGDTIDAQGNLVVPGFIDLDPHGGGGHWTTHGDANEIARALDFHLDHGTTRSLVSLTSAPIQTLLSGLGAVAQLQRDPGFADRIAGVHLEGPFLNTERAGAQPRAHLQLPSLAVLDQLLDEVPGLVKMVTLAPELPGALALVQRVVSAGVLAAIGHTDGTYAEVTAAFDYGATVTTHLFNGMPPLQSREPGCVGATLAHPRISASFVADGVHVHDASVVSAMRSLGPDRVLLVTDASAVAGLDEGTHVVGDRALEIAGGAAYEAGTDLLVGSTLTMDAVFRRAVTSLGMSIGDAVRATSTNPAELLGIHHDVGTIQAGKRADLVVLDGGFNLRAVVHNGLLRPVDGQGAMHYVS